MFRTPFRAVRVAVIICHGTVDGILLLRFPSNQRYDIYIYILEIVQKQ